MRFIQAILSAALCWGAICPSAHATQYQVTIDSTPILGADAQLAIDFIDGGPPLSRVLVTGFSTDGILGSTATSGGATGNLADTVMLVDSDFFNEMLVNLTLGSTLSFVFTPELLGPETPTVPDVLSVFLLDATSGLPLFATNDPTGADALFTFAIDGSANGELNIYSALQEAATVSVAPLANTVPEPSSLIQVLSWLALLALVSRNFRRTSILNSHQEGV